MKYVLLMLFSLPVLASEFTVTENRDIPVPKGLELGSVVVVTPQGSFRAKSSEYALVKRKQNGPKKTTVTRDFTKPSYPNTVKLFAGYGTNGMKLTPATGPITGAEQGFGANFGVGYERDVADHWSVDVIGIGNAQGFNSGLLGIGYKF